MTKTRKIIFSWLLLLSFTGLFSQQLRFKHISTEEGLSTNFVRAIIQDDKGFLWFGTQDGLNKYDGYQVKIYKNEPGDTASLSNSEITSLLQVRSDLIIVGTRDGVCFFNPLTENFSVLNKKSNPPAGRINSIFAKDSNNILIGTDAGLFRIDLTNKNVMPFRFNDGPVNIRCISEVGGEIYIGTMGRGLWRLTHSSQIEKVIFEIPDYVELSQDALSSITFISQYAGKMYLGTNGYGIVKVDRGSEIDAHITFRQQHENSDIIRNFIIRNNKIYVASAHGVLVYNLISKEVNPYVKQDAPLSLNSNAANCIFMDNQNNFWIGTDQGGVNIAFSRSLKFPLSTLSFETGFNNVYAFQEVRKNQLLIGGAEVFHEINLETGQTIDHSQFLKGGTVLCILRESENIFWVGTSGDGLFRYDRSTRTAKEIPGLKPGTTIFCLLRENDHLYAGTLLDGLLKINIRTNSITRFPEIEGLSDQAINTIYKDHKGFLWLGTYDAGLVKLSMPQAGTLPVIERVYTSKGQKGHIASNIIFDIKEDDRNNLWITTSLGLSKLLSDQTFHNFYEKDGLSNTYLHTIVKDSVGNFWMSSNGGLMRFNPLKAENEIAFKNYGIKDGLVNTEYNMGAALSSTTGMMYFGGPRGFNAFRPTTIKENLHVPPVYAVSLKRQGQDVQLDTSITYKRSLSLNWSENYFQLEVVALDFTDPDKNKFRYMLEGYDKDWSTPSSVRFISYTELPGGSYKLKIKAANNDGIWNETPYELHITVVPPFWKTTTFYFIMILIGIAVVYIYTQYRTRAIKSENRLLERKVAQRTRELEAKNKDITSSIQYAKRIQEAILPSRDHIFKRLKKVFILYRPKDIVSGDFYWFAERNNTKIFAVVDCTGHGVPGAFMSMIGHNLLHQIVNEKGIIEPSEILNELHQGVQNALRQGHNEVNTNDGMDVSVITINDTTRDVRWAGANRPLIIIDANGEFTKYDGNKYPVGGTQADQYRIFTTHVIRVKVASMAYLFTDGYADQFGGDRGKKFMVRRFHELLTQIHLFSAEEQKVQLEKNFEDWRQNHEQVDDVLIVGIEI